MTIVTIPKSTKDIVKEVLRNVYDKVRPSYFSIFNSKRFTVTIHNNYSGFFAQLNWCLYILSFCEDKGLIPDIYLTGENYLAPELGENWFRYFFEVPELSGGNLYKTSHSKSISNITITHILQLLLPSEHFDKMTVLYASNLMQKYMHINQYMQTKVDTYFQKYFQGKFVLGIHYRGTDKIVESPRVSWEYVKKVVNNYLNKHPKVDCLFVASDEGDFIDYIKNEFQFIPVFNHEDQLKAINNEAFHHINLGKDNFKKGEEALINALLLSRCNVLIRTSSFLSAWASIFNPDLPIILLNSPNKNTLWFPDKELMSKSMNQYLIE
ncbi:nodulation protein NodZ [Nostoc sp. MG11]|uniref:nodulation protein NodZ n=1 Tax=Nostoc sp. MG11 TaxID=2721166 RepID=UPI001867E7AB|nr:nodulation protein NodZ [Nostoc sp. MG11]